MTERNATLHVGGRILPGSIVASSSGLDETFFPFNEIELRRGPSEQAEPLLVDPVIIAIKPLGKPKDGYQKVSVAVDKDNEPQELYLVKA